MATTRTSKFVIEDKSVELSSLDAGTGSAGQAIGIGQTGSLAYIDVINQAELPTKIVDVFSGGDQDNVSVSYNPNAESINFTTVRGYTGSTGGRGNTGFAGSRGKCADLVADAQRWGA